MALNKLNDAEIKAARPRDKVLKLSDGGGLQLWVTDATDRIDRQLEKLIEQVDDFRRTEDRR